MALRAFGAYKRSGAAGALPQGEFISPEDGKTGRAPAATEPVREEENARLAARLTGYKIDIKPASYKDEEEE